MKIISTLPVLLIFFSSCSTKLSTDQSLSIHFDSPAHTWEESLPLGNGRIGLMPDGDTDKEKYVLNEISTWTGSIQNADNPEANKYLGKIRDLLFEGKNQEAQELIYKTFTCGGVGSFSGHSYHKPYGSYQLFGNLTIEYLYPDAGETSGYLRQLDLPHAIHTTSFTRNGIKYRREAFASYDGDVAVIHLCASKRGALSFNLGMDRKSNVEQRESWLPVISEDNGDMIYSCRLHDGTEADDADILKGMKLGGRVRIILPKGGEKSFSDGMLTVKGATEVTILIAMNTDFFGEDPDSTSRDQIENASTQAYGQLRKRHAEAFNKLFGRVDVNFGHNIERESMPMNERLEAFAKDDNDPSLSSLYYQFGRYLLISSTRPGTLPPNLQGLWAKSINTPWNGDYHLNINLQMNLWPAESGNLGELQLPLVEWTKGLVKSGQNTANVFYGARGWVSHSISNVWQFTAPGEHPSWGATNTSAAWLCEHLYKHYQYTLDKEYLSDVYPTMKEAALFFVDMLVENPKTHYLVTAPTTSPENAYRMSDGSRVSVCPGSTMDNQIIRELFSNVIEASSILGIDRDFADTLNQKRSRLMPTTIGTDGRIMEWPEEYQEIDPHHRHVSHLYGLYPANEISPLTTPELAEAARKTLEVRTDKSTGWSMAWKINFWARLHDGEHAYKLFRELMTPVSSDNMNYMDGGGSYANLFCAHPPFQIDGNFGGAAGIAEMLLQSQNGVIEVLPALPAAWKTGYFNRLCAQGGSEVSASWRDGEITGIILKARTDGEFMIKDFMEKPVFLKEGESWTYRR